MFLGMKQNRLPSRKKKLSLRTTAAGCQKRQTPLGASILCAFRYSFRESYSLPPTRDGSRAAIDFIFWNTRSQARHLDSCAGRFGCRDEA
jgi:hypothetical protein